MPKPVRTVNFGLGVHARPMRGARLHWCCVNSESFAPAVPSNALFPAISSPELVIVSVEASYPYRLGLKVASLPYFSVRGPSKSQRSPRVSDRLLRTL